MCQIFQVSYKLREGNRVAHRLADLRSFVPGAETPPSYPGRPARLTGENSIKFLLKFTRLKIFLVPLLIRLDEDGSELRYQKDKRVGA
uniref:Uncharacterized protein n=1 Tax=Oryza barthii TaxID=65489 RepID=A0A0D3HWB3_9ORYZ